MTLKELKNLIFNIPNNLDHKTVNVIIVDYKKTYIGCTIEEFDYDNQDENNMTLIFKEPNE